MINRKSFSFPDFNRILATCHHEPKVEEYATCRNAFPSLLRYQLQHGHIPDEIFEESGFLVDLDFSGKEVRRDATISQESYQRTQTLSHEFQVQLRADRRAFIMAEKVRKEAVVNTKVLALLATNKKCKEKLLPLAPQPAINPDELQQSPLSFLRLEDFAKCKSDFLKAFAHVRTFSTSKRSGTWPTKKGTIQDASNGTDCILLRAFECRGSPVILEKPAPLHPDRTGAGAAPGAAPSRRNVQFPRPQGWLLGITPIAASKKQKTSSISSSPSASTSWFRMVSPF